MSRILIVEDEQHLADGLRYNLEAEQYDVDVVDNGEEALVRVNADSTRYDMLILDLMLPGIDGFAAQPLRAVAGDRHDTHARRADRGVERRHGEHLA